jgi:hypothetical protein
MGHIQKATSNREANKVDPRGADFHWESINGSAEPYALVTALESEVSRAMIVSIAERIADLLFELDVIGAVESFNEMTENAEIKVNATVLLVDALGKSGDRVDNAMVAIIGWVDPFYADDTEVMEAVRVGITNILSSAEKEA